VLGSSSRDFRVSIHQSPTLIGIYERRRRRIENGTALAHQVDEWLRALRSNELVRMVVVHDVPARPALLINEPGSRLLAVIRVEQHIAEAAT
jgi:hypothetical protein